MARISNSVYPDICPGDPTCSKFGFGANRQPSKMMSESLLYKLHSGGYGTVTVDSNRFKNVFNSKFGKVRIWEVLSISEKSKAWNADPANRMCDAPGSWYCEGQYPPLFLKLFDKQGIKKKDFRQLEDFNVKTDEDDKKYQEKYHKRMAGGAKTADDEEAAEKQAARDKADRAKAYKKKQKKEKAAAATKATAEKTEKAEQKERMEQATEKAGKAAKAAEATEKEEAQAEKAKQEAKKNKFHRRRRRDAAVKDAMAAEWKDTDDTERIHDLIMNKDADGLEDELKANPALVHIRSADGQGPLWWAHEAGDKTIRKLLTKNGCQKDLKDKNGNLPKSAKKKKKKKSA
jgi:hypothetical protein